MPPVNWRLRTDQPSCGAFCRAGGCAPAAGVMVRVDVWDIPRADTDESILIGLPQTFHERYVLGEQLGQGGFGVVPPCPLPFAHVPLIKFSP